MMKYIIFSLLAVLVGLQGMAQKGKTYQIAGNIKGVDSGYVWMKQKTGDGYRLIDSARINEGKFSFEGKVETGIQSVNLYFNKERGTLMLFLEPGKIQIEAFKDSIYYARVTGTPNNECWGNYVRGDRRMAEKEDQCSKLYQASFETKDRAKIKAAEKIFTDAMAERKQLKTDFLTAPRNKYVAACWYRASLIHRLQFQTLDSLANALGAELSQNNDYQLILARRELTKKQVMGQAFGDIRLPASDGQERSLDMLRGKWVLVDFWASWCGPCRREGKHVLELYKKYHADGFEVFGVSIDQNTDAWKKAIAEDQTDWIHVCDSEGKVAQEYGITVVPHIFLIDPEGKIAAINIRGEELTRRLEQIFKK